MAKHLQIASQIYLQPATLLTCGNRDKETELEQAANDA